MWRVVPKLHMKASQFYILLPKDVQSIIKDKDDWHVCHLRNGRHFYLENNVSTRCRPELNIAIGFGGTYGKVAYCIRVYPAETWLEHDSLTPLEVRYHGLKNQPRDGKGPVPAEEVMKDITERFSEGDRGKCARPASIEWLVRQY